MNWDTIALLSGTIAASGFFWLGGFLYGVKRRETDFARLAKASRWAYAPVDLPDYNGDGAAPVRLYELAAGHVLTRRDVQDVRDTLEEIELLLIHNADTFNSGRWDAAKEIGGEELIRALKDHDVAKVHAIAASAIARFESRSS
jgi:hypothetical protein